MEQKPELTNEVIIFFQEIALSLRVSLHPAIGKLKKADERKQ